ncbi:MAG: hypothetical protein GY720_23320 [bacterium]|nr:hypothetical protein [bacterium]
MSFLLAHVGGRSDLPVPLGFFVVGAGVAVVIAFAMVSANWLEPRLQGSHATQRSGLLPRWVPRLLSLTGAGGLVLVVANGIFDGTGSTRSIGAVIVWIVFWLALPFASVVIGGLWFWMSPYRRLVYRTSRRVAERVDLRAGLGVWPATGAFVAFTWLELVYPDNTLPQTLATAAVVYGAYLVALSRWLGPQTALNSAEAFEVYTDTIAHIAPVRLMRLPHMGRPRLERRRWLVALPHLPIPSGMVTFIIAMIGTVTYDGMSGAGWWADLVGEARRDMWFETVALLATCALIGGTYLAASHLAGSLAGDTRPAGAIARRFAHTLVPIAFAYAFAHYFTLIVFEGQQLLHAASDPFGRGWDLFGTADWRVVFTPSQLWVWYVQVLVIVLGHVAGVVLAHDRALAEFGAEVAVRTQYAMLVLMVALTSLGLFILAG